MIAPGLLIGLCWLVFIIYWTMSAFSAKRSVRSERWWRFAWIRILALALIITVVRFSVVTGHSAVWSTPYPFGPIGVVLGLLCTALGIALAVWARAYLGRNWGMPMSLKENSELVTTGPYATIRHPIYSGMLLAMLGSLLADSLVWSIPLVCAAAYFIYSAFSEERLMRAQFPQTYPAYQKSSKMFIPFVV